MQTAEQLRAKAAECYARAAESFERCDTDGFLSQWASNFTARLYEKQAEVAENGGRAQFWGLYKDGERVAAKLINGKYGLCWAFVDNDGRFTGKFLKHPLCASLYTNALECLDTAKHWADPDTIAERQAQVEVEVAALARWSEKHGYELRREWAPAKVVTKDKGKGLSGTCWIEVIRTDGL